MSNEKVTYKELRSAVVQVDNSADEGRAYGISADVRVQNPGGVEAFEGGTVTKDGAQVAAFSCWGGDSNVSVQYIGIESSEQVAVLQAVNGFMEATRQLVASSQEGGGLPGEEGETPAMEPAMVEALGQQIMLSRMTINTMSLTDEQALEVKSLYPEWGDLIGQELDEGFRLQHEGVLYRVLQKHTTQQDWTPGTATASLYAVVSASAAEEHAGTREDPIPYVQGMLIEKDKYYTEGGILYVGLMDAPNGYPNDLKDLPTLASVVTEEE